MSIWENSSADNFTNSVVDHDLWLLGTEQYSATIPGEGGGNISAGSSQNRGNMSQRNGEGAGIV